MDKIEKIRQEIERQISAHDSVDHLEAFEVGKAWNRGHRKALESLLSFLDTLENKPDKSLEEAAEEYEDWAESYSQSDFPTCISFRQAFIAGAEWQKAKMMKEAVEGEVYQYHSYNRDAIAILVDIPKENLGDKVRIIIVKED